MTNKVGYRSPPAEKQFKKGQSGNPKGRPKGSKNFQTLLAMEFDKPVVVVENGKRKKVSRLQAMVMKVASNAMSPDPKLMLGAFEILRRAGLMNQAPPERLVPDNYEDLLADYLKTHSESS